MHGCVNSKRKRQRMDKQKTGSVVARKEKIPKESQKIGKKKRVSKQIHNIKNKCTNEKAAWIRL